MTRTCAVAGCDRKHMARGYCSVHYSRLRQKGDVCADVPVRRRPLWTLDTDDVAVDRLVSGEPPAVVTKGERLTAIAAMTAHGLSSREIAARVGCSGRTVVRYRRLAEALTEAKAS